MTGFIVSVFPFRNRVSPNEAFEGLELGEGKLSRPVLRGPVGRKAAWLLGSYSLDRAVAALHSPPAHEISSSARGNPYLPYNEGLPRASNLALQPGLDHTPPRAQRKRETHSGGKQWLKQ